MEFDHVPRIWKSDRLIYRSISSDDQEWMFNELESDPMNHFLSTPLILAPPRRKKPDEWMDMWKSATSILGLVICLQPQEEHQKSQSSSPEEQNKQGPAGDVPQPTRIGILRLSYGGYGTSPHNRAGDLGLALTAPYQGKGYGTEAVNWTLDWAFRHANMHSVNLGSVAYNTRAHRCYEKCGFKLQGRRREVCWHDRKWHDLLLFGILENEWEELWKKRTQGVQSPALEW